MGGLRQIAAVTFLNLRTIPQRLGSSAVAVVGIAGVVVVLVAVLSIAEGFFAAMQSAGSPTRALIMRSGADSEMTSGLSGPETDIIKQAPGIARDGQHDLGHDVALVVQPGVVDPSRAPEGQHTLWAYCHVPNGCQVDRTEAVLGQVERPGVVLGGDRNRRKGDRRRRAASRAEQDQATEIVDPDTGEITPT